MNLEKSYLASAFKLTVLEAIFFKSLIILYLSFAEEFYTVIDWKVQRKI